MAALDNGWTPEPGSVIALGVGSPPDTADQVAAIGFVPVPVGDLAARDAEVAITHSPDDVRRLPSLRWVHSPFDGVDRLLSGRWPLDGRRAAGVPVPFITRTVGDMPRRIGDYALAVALAQAWRLGDYAEQQQRRLWAMRPRRPWMFDQEAVVFGTGHVGRAVAQAFAAYGVPVTGVNRSGRLASSHEGAPSPYARVVERDAVCRGEVSGLDAAGPVVVALPLTPHTRGVIDACVLRSFHGAHLINVGRGATLDTSDVVAALERGHLSHVTTDVLEVEPPLAGDRLWEHPRVTVTPHIAGPTTASDVVGDLVRALDDLRAGRTPGNLVDPARGY